MYKSHKEIQELLLFASLCHYAAIAQKQGKKKSKNDSIQA